MRAQGLLHAIGSDKFPAPQGTLMATLIKGLLAFNLDWQFVLVGVFTRHHHRAVRGEVAVVRGRRCTCRCPPPLPIFVGGAIKGIGDWVGRRKGERNLDSELGPGNLFATGLVAGGALAGVLVAMLSVNDGVADGHRQGVGRARPGRGARARAASTCWGSRSSPSCASCCTGSRAGPPSCDVGVA